MLTQAENDLLTRVGTSTPMGQLFRRFWLPAMLASELPAPDCPPIRVRLLGEDLVAFRDSNGRPGVLAANCAHRGAWLFFGRNEECGLCCVYHGWKYDVDGNCVDMPNEPPTAGSEKLEIGRETQPQPPRVRGDFKHKVQQLAYPACEAGKVIWDTKRRVRR